jgi:hypothetical protein
MARSTLYSKGKLTIHWEKNNKKVFKYLSACLSQPILSHFVKITGLICQWFQTCKRANKNRTESRKLNYFAFYISAQVDLFGD